MICLFAAHLHAQDPVLDSLQLLLKSAPRDTHRVTLLNMVAKRISDSEFESSLGYMSESMALADSLGFTKGLAEAKISYAEAQNQLGGLARSMESSLQAYDLFSKLKDTLGIARTLMTIGLVQNKLLQTDKAEATLEKSAACYAAIGDKRGEISASHNLAVIYSTQKDTAAARARYLANLILLQGTPYNHIFAATYNNLGNLFDPVTQGDSAIHYYQVALSYKLSAKILNQGGIGNSMMNIANVHLLRGDLRQAASMLDEAAGYVIASNENQRLLELYELRGQLYFKMGRYKESAQNFELQAMLQDSMFAPQMVEQASRLEAAYNSQNQEKEIALLNQAKAIDAIEKTRLQWITAAVAIALLFALALLLVVIFRGRERSRMLKLLSHKSDEINRQQQEIVLQNEALSLQNERLSNVNREKDGLIGIVAHDIRAPLNRSAALAELISGLGNLSSEQQRYLEMIKKVSNDGGRLIQDLLELNAYEQDGHHIELTEVDLKLVVEHTYHGFTADAAQKGIEIIVSAESTVAKTDEKLLGRILDNLLSNAVKFTPKGKKIYISISTDVDRHWITIRDEGPGIGTDDQKKMFQKFMRLSARPTGGESSTGLGLSIVRALADKIGVELSFESTLGTGTTFRVGVRKIG